MGLKTKLTFDSWLDQFGIEKLAALLKVRTQTIRYWRVGHSDPAVKHMRRIKALTKGRVSYDLIIDRRGRQ